MIRKSHGGLALALALAMSSESFAYTGVWGAGLAGAIQNCPYGVDAGDGAISKSDEMIEIEERRVEIADDIRELKRELNDLGKEIRDSERQLRVYLRDNAVSDIKLHIKSQKACADWTVGRDGVPIVERAETNATTDEQVEKPVEVAAPVGGGRRSADTGVVPEKLSGFLGKDWTRVCIVQGGNRQIGASAVCNTTADIVSTSPRALAPVDRESCTTNLDRFQTATARQTQLAKEIERLQAERKGLSKDYRRATREFKKDLKDGVYDDYETTEGTYCAECEFRRRQGYKSKPNWANVAANVLGGSLLIWAGNRAQQNHTSEIASYNAPLGFETPNLQQNYSTFYPGIGLIMNGIAGAMGGGTGRGSFACNGGVNGGANSPLWGYPQNIWGQPQAGGAFIPGQTPWGGNGYPFSIPGYTGTPGFANFPAIPGGGYPGGIPGGFPGGFPGGYPGGFPGGIPGGMPGGGYAFDPLGQIRMQQQYADQQMNAYRMQLQQQLVYQQAQTQQYGMLYQNEARKQQALTELKYQIESLYSRYSNVLGGSSYPLAGGGGNYPLPYYGGNNGIYAGAGAYGSISIGGGYGGISAGGSLGIGVGTNINGGVNYNGNGSYLYNPGTVGLPGAGSTGCVGLSCTPSGVPNGVPLGPTR